MRQSTKDSLTQWQKRAAALRQECFALYLACRDPRVPWTVRFLALVLVAYCFSPLDLVPDFIPVLGQLDDLLLVPLGAALDIRMIPEPVLAECRERARQQLMENPPVVRWAAVGVAAVWGLILLAAAVVVWRLLSS